MSQQQKSRLEYLLQQYADDNATPVELKELTQLLLQNRNDAELQQILHTISQNIPALTSYDESEVNRMIQAILEKTSPRRVFLWRRIAVAASVVLALGVGSYFAFFQKSRIPDPESRIATHDVKAPETNKATITLADGRIVSLDEIESGTLAMQGNVKLVKNADGKIVYSSEPGVGSQELKYNTLTNPRGSRVIDMTLSDGSHVWLNAGSSVTYPVAFVGDERKVSITGEAYFEVTHDATKPFYVTKADMNIQVLGTKFNINAYDDEVDIKVTLLEGSVKVSNNVEQAILKPGEQAVGTSHSPFTIHHSPDPAQVMAWKEGWFEFDNISMEVIMRQVSRWYDLEIVYEQKPSATKYGGRISKELSLSAILQMLEKNGAKFRLDGKKLFVKS